MKVAIVGPYPLQGLPPGGIESVTAALVAGFREIGGVEFHVITVAFPGARAGTNSLGPGITLHALRSSGMVRRPTLYYFERRSIARLLRRLHVDIVHVQGQNFYAAAAIASKVPTVISVHGMLSREAHILDERSHLRERISKRLRGSFNARFEAMSLREARDLIINNPYVEKIIAPLTHARVHWLDNPVEQRFFDVADTPEPRRVFFAGSFQPRKSQHLLVEAACVLRDRGEPIELRIAGPVLDPGYADEVRQATADAGLLDTVHFLGVIDDAALLDEYARAAVVVMASTEETSPMFLQQAMAAGKPAVAPDVGGVRYVIENGVTGLVTPPGDPGALADALATILDDDIVRVAMGTAAREAATARFHTRAVAQRTLDVYAAMLGQRA
jgi:glycosyltransferase involved in cell wall biosynthesis